MTPGVSIWLIPSPFTPQSARRRLACFGSALYSTLSARHVTTWVREVPRCIPWQCSSCTSPANLHGHTQRTRRCARTPIFDLLDGEKPWRKPSLTRRVLHSSCRPSAVGLVPRIRRTSSPQSLSPFGFCGGNYTKHGSESLAILALKYARSTSL